MREIHNLIDGKNIPGEGRTINIVDPSTETVIGSLRNATHFQVGEAAGAAKRSFESGVWSRVSHAERSKVLRRAADSIRRHAGELCRQQVAESGIPAAQVLGHIAGAAGWFDYYADFLSRESGESYRQLFSATTLVEREPMGVCALFSPWNVPIGLSALKLAPALAAGNSVVLKPSEQTPMAIRRMVDIIAAAGLPDGVLNCVNGSGAVTGKMLAASPDIDMIGFTGGGAGGAAVAVEAARRHLPCILELGGKSATIVFDDTDIPAAVEGSLRAAYGNNGLACLAGSRILLQEGVAEAFLDGFRTGAEAMKIGDPRNSGVAIGPMISGAHRNKVLDYYRSAEADGDEILFGGRADGAGYFLRPGAIRIASRRSRIWREEAFGPLVAFAEFESEEEAVMLANDSEFGLSGYLWTRHIERALRVSRRLRTGTVVVNGSFMRELNAPFGGFKNSGVGREGGAYSWENFTEAKTTVIHHGRRNQC